MESLGEILTRIVKKKSAAEGIGRESGGAAQAAEPEPACRTCGDLGWVTKNVRLGDPDFGEAFPCQCQLSDEKTRRRLLRYSELPHEANPQTFETFEYVPGTEKCLTACHRFVEQDGWPYLLVMVGQSGNGKSHLLQAIGWELLARGQQVKYGYVPALLEELRSTYDPEAEVRYGEVYRAYAKAEVLLLDDLGAEKQSSWTNSTLTRVIEERIQYERPMVISANLSIGQMERLLGPRLADRLYDTGSGAVEVVTNTAASYRTGRVWASQGRR